MLSYASKVEQYCEGYTYEKFIADSRTVEACVFNLSQIGELCRVLNKDFTDSHPEIKWYEIYGLRNRIIHDYEGVNLKLVWEIIIEDLPGFIGQLRDISCP